MMRKRVFNLVIFMLIAMITGACAPDSLREIEAVDLSSRAPTGELGEVLTEGIGSPNFFFQNGEIQRQKLAIYADYQDSFKMRGDQLHKYLYDRRSSNAHLCFSFFYPNTYGTSAKQVLVLAAKVRNTYNYKLRGREYFLQFFPTDETENLSRCQSAEFLDQVTTQYGVSVTKLAYSATNVCPECAESIFDQEMVIRSANGQRVREIEQTTLGLIIIPAKGNLTSQLGQACQSDENCKALSFDCCLEGQCVNHRQIKPQIDQSSDEYLQILEQIRNSPQLINSFTDTFYICPNYNSDNPDNTGDDPSLNPDLQAQELLTKLEDLYNCLNPRVDELAVCTTEVALDKDAISSTGQTLELGLDDLTFISDTNSIFNIEFQGTRLYQKKMKADDFEIPGPVAGITIIPAASDNLTTSTSLLITRPVEENLANQSIKVRFTVDGTCERIGSQLARCTKFYVQGQNLTGPERSSNHDASSNVFEVPSYASSLYTYVVSLSDLVLPPSSTTWLRDASGNVVFQNTVFANQEVEITYYVQGPMADILTNSKNQAQEIVDDECHCEQDDNCNLRPVIQEVEGILKTVNYECTYPGPDVPEPPFQRTVYVSAQSAPHRYFDTNGVHYPHDNTGQGLEQEGLSFLYNFLDPLRPNNIKINASSPVPYVGFNEIYGSFQRGPQDAKPAHELILSKGRQYDIFVDQGTFSSCLDCGNDYFSSLKRLFTQNFLHSGGGYLPNYVESRSGDKNRSEFASIEMKFGRACFLPATMIPWTHTQNDDDDLRRRNRLSAQHFLFANGLKTDWYGFDYGSLIGSFDGVTWFSIGNQRRVVAKSNRLYLAVNAYFADQTVGTSFKVTVSEVTSIIDSGSEVNHDTMSDGAQCQVSHFCESDQECISTLGHDYVCTNVQSIRTPWPRFDDNASELNVNFNTTLANLVSGVNGRPKRCVYRGQGAPCDPNYSSSSTESDSYASSLDPKLHLCSPNTQCVSLDDTNQRFNQRIARFAASVKEQNLFSELYDVEGKTDTFGLGSRIIGRPMKHEGEVNVAAQIKTILQSNNIRGLCLPGNGQAPSETTPIIDLKSDRTQPKSDLTNGVGITNLNTPTANTTSLALCPAVDENGEYTHLQHLDDPLNTSHLDHAIGQNMSTESFNLSFLNFFNLYIDPLSTSPITTAGLMPNSCLKTAGSPCFQDFECSPNRLVASRARAISFTSSLGISEPELRFMQEELTCANDDIKYIPNDIYPNPNYTQGNHKCCRELGLRFTMDTQTESSMHQYVDLTTKEVLVPGVNLDLNDSRRYSRANVFHEIQQTKGYLPPVAQSKESTTHFNLDTLGIGPRMYKSLHAHNERMCCTGHWVREFNVTNTQGHRFRPEAAQNFNYSTFQSLVWEDIEAENPPDFIRSDLSPFSCGTINSSPWCAIKNLSNSQEEKYLKYFGKFELLGIPQVLIESSWDDAVVPQPKNDFLSNVTAIDQTKDPALDIPFMVNVANPESALLKKPGDENYNASLTLFNNETYFSAADDSKINYTGSGLKKVFSENTFSCCRPTGQALDPSTTADQCCTGTVTTNQEGVTFCCLGDYTNLSVYTNRYVSSEGASINGQPLDDNSIDPLSGYVDPFVLLTLAGSMCCSGTAQLGVAVDDYLMPLNGGVNSQLKTRRFLYDPIIDNDGNINPQGAINLFEAGVRWNHHVYCVPGGAGNGGGVVGQ